MLECWDTQSCVASISCTATRVRHIHGGSELSALLAGRTLEQIHKSIGAGKQKQVPRCEEPVPACNALCYTENAFCGSRSVFLHHKWSKSCANTGTSAAAEPLMSFRGNTAAQMTSVQLICLQIIAGRIHETCCTHMDFYVS